MTEIGPSSESARRPFGSAKVWTCLGLLIVLAVGLTLRLYKLDQPVMWCDEAESSINALTILQHGVPIDTYLGLPIYENTLTELWPEHPEYEFKDSSYSKKGLAIYHGWLPLYSIAGSFKLFGIEPDTDTTTLKPVHDAAAISKRTIAARLPSVLASIVFMLLLYICGREMYGRDAGWAAIMVGAIAIPTVHIARQARYYSLTAALSAACCLAGWRLYKRGWWRDFIFAGICFALLFHTHILTFAIACVACSTLLPFLFRHEKAIAKMAVAAAIIAAATLPWMYFTGFLDSAQSVPKAIATMKLPDDLISWPKKHWKISCVLLAGMVFSLLLHLRPQWFADRIHRAFSDHRAAFYFLGAWIVIAFIMFMTLIPAASLFFQRLYLGAIGPGIVFGAMLFAGVGRSMGKRIGVPLAMAAFVLFGVLQTYTIYTWNRHRGQRDRMAWFVNDIRNWDLKPGTRIYSTPNDHLTLTFYTGIPVQSIAPVRKSFLDNYPNDVVLVLCWIPVWPLDEQDVRETVARWGKHYTPEEISEWTDKVNRVGAARKVAGRVQRVVPAIDRLPDWAEALLDWQLDRTAQYRRSINYEMMNPSVFRGYTEYRDHLTMWEVFFYRFVNPRERIGNKVNYANRLARAEARVLPTLWIVYSSPGAANLEQASIQEKRHESSH
jgi:uncharacterized membrane protein